MEHLLCARALSECGGHSRTQYRDVLVLRHIAFFGALGEGSGTENREMNRLM